MRLLFSARAVNNVAGGVERMIITVMNALVERGHDVDFLTWDQKDATTFYPLDARVKWHRMNIGDPTQRATLSILRNRMTAVRSMLRTRKPEVIVAFQDGPYKALRLFSVGTGIPVIVAERNAPTRFNHTRAGARRRLLTFNSFRLAHTITIQCEGYRKLYPPYLHKKILTIPNPVTPAQLSARPDVADARGRFHLLSVGRLGWEKNFQSLIEAFSGIASRFPDWDLIIVGEGQQRTELETMVQKKELEHRIFLPGPTPDVNRAYESAHLFCLSSRWEGFPNALAEAQAHGLPVVGFSDCAGVNELIQHGETGLLATGNGESANLAVTLSNLMTDAKMRREMGNRGRKAVASFAPNLIIDQWEMTLQQAINGCV
ncbi:glycosyltransferase family 4 protein [Thalassospira marina]|uniref:Glycosyl transferase family 1 n=1 Tax=Thalassospira marina TaxID=2048283 RepID=A0A2N3KVI7_9PROT|nr:glycosyltransferase family 4 protein [Thalassospira marina]PKR54589.1 glycosyl transferase family 1 [Thalassospira marina]